MRVQERSRLTDYVKEEVAANMVDRLLVSFSLHGEMLLDGSGAMQRRLTS